MGVGEMGQGGQKVQTSSYKINQSWECNVHHDDYCQQYCIIHTKVAKRLNSSHQDKEIIIWHDRGVS